MSMDGVVKNIFTLDEWSVLSEFEKEIAEKVQELPTELIVDSERMGESVDE